MPAGRIAGKVTSGYTLRTEMALPRSSTATRRRIFDAAYALFYARGIGRVGVDEIAAAAGLTKRTLYRHFASKDTLLAAVLEDQHALALARIRAWGDRLEGDPGAIVGQLFAELGSWAATPRWTGAGFTRLVMELADLPGHPARAIAARHKAAVEAWLAGRLGQAGVADAAARARELVLLLEGTSALMLIHGDRSYAQAAAAAARRLVAPDPAIDTTPAGPDSPPHGPGEAA
ncbi:MAG: helix-turn-helix domain-containing protein [Geminicoccaceae bacterium]